MLPADMAGGVPAARAANLEAGGEALTTFMKRVGAVLRDLESSAGNPKRVSAQTINHTSLSSSCGAFSEAHALAASALTSASAALVWSAHLDWTANQVVRSLMDTAGRTWPKDDAGKYLGYGPIRPRKVLENPTYDAGPANVNPLAAEDGEKAAGEVKPSTPASASSQPARNASGSEASAAGSGAETSNDSNTLRIALGAAAAAVVIGGGGFAVLRARRAG